MTEGWSPIVARWTGAGVLDEATAARILAFETQRGRSGRLHWPIRVALGFGALMLGAGALLFVSAHWDTLSPQARFSLVLLLVAMFHAAGAAVAERFSAMATALHAIGTVACGAGIYLAGQIFHLDGHWPTALLLWAAGAGCAWFLLRHGPQLALLALLVPAWLSSEWFLATEASFLAGGARIAACGLFLLALSYFTAVRKEGEDVSRRALMWLGAISLLPAGLALTFAARSDVGLVWMRTPLPMDLRAIGWTVAVGLPSLLAIALRRKAAWPNLAAVLWALVLVNFTVGSIAMYGWCALGATALVAWGSADARSERINMGCAFFAFTVLAFYFSQVMDKLGRSVSLAGLGVLFLVGGWGLDHVRRQLVRQTRRSEA